VAQHSISGTFEIEFVHLRRPDDEARGYLLVLIPASPDAPHQVQVGDDRRFYGRSDTGNRRLSEEEIARLYERRRSQQVDREQLLGGCIERSPFGQPEPGRQGFLHAFSHPAVRDDDLWDRALAAAGGEEPLLQTLAGAVQPFHSVGWGGPHLGLGSRWEQRGADKWSLSYGRRDAEDVSWVARADLSMDGRAELFYGRAAGIAQRDQGGHEVLVAYETGVALTLAEFLAVVGALYANGGLHGYVDIGMAVTGIRGAMSSHRFDRPFRMDASTYGDERALRTLRCTARELSDDPLDLVRRLTARLMRALHGADFDPLSDSS
jgi:hypothetical protein